MRATIFPHDEGVAVWLSGFEDEDDHTTEVICDTKDDAEALIKDIERVWHRDPAHPARLIPGFRYHGGVAQVGRGGGPKNR
jgi:hypothetical protein